MHDSYQVEANRGGLGVSIRGAVPADHRSLLSVLSFLQATAKLRRAAYILQRILGAFLNGNIPYPTLAAGRFTLQYGTNICTSISLRDTD